MGWGGSGGRSDGDVDPVAMFELGLELVASTRTVHAPLRACVTAYCMGCGDDTPDADDVCMY